MQGFSHLLEMLIIDFNSNVNDRNPISGETPLHLAVINNNVQVIKVWIIIFSNFCCIFCIFLLIQYKNYL